MVYSRLTSLLVLVLSSVIGLSQDWSSLNSAGLDHYQKGQYEQAEPIIEQALSAAQKAHGKASEQYVTSLNNYAYLQQKMGHFQKALANFHEVCSLSQSLYGEHSIEYIESLINKANVFLNNGSYDSCEIVLASARQLVLAEAQQNTAAYQQNIIPFFEALVKIQSATASLFYTRGQVQTAISTLEEQKKSMEIAYGSDINISKTYFELLNNLSTYYLDNQQPEKAQALLEKTLAFEKERYGVTSPKYYNSLNNLGSIYRKTDKLDSAQIIWEVAEKGMSKTEMSGSKTHLSLLNNLGEMSLEIEDYPTALRYLIKSKTLHHQRASKMPRLYQVTLFNLAEAYRWNGNYHEADSLYQELINKLIDNVVHEFTYLSEAEKRAFYQDQLYYIEAYLGFAFEITNLVPLQDSDTPYINPAVAGQLYDLQLMTKAIILNSSRKMKNHILNGSDEVLKQNYELWEEKKSLLATLYNSGQGTAKDLLSLVSDISILEGQMSRSSQQFHQGFSVEKVTWQDVQRKLKPDEVAVEIIRVINGAVYLAVIITSETIDMPVLAMAISQKGKFLEKEFYNQYHNAIQYGVKDTTSYGVYWQPIRDAIIAHSPKNKMPKKVYLSADGIYSQLNLNTLLNNETQQYLIDETEIHLLTNTKEIIEEKFSAKPSTRPKKAVLFGDPSFSTGNSPSTGSFARLAGTGLEIALIEKHLQEHGWQTESYKEDEARVGNLKNSSNMDVLHLATHGFFVSNKESSMIDILLSSGLAFAGANNASPTSGEDGILSAYETVALDLDSTELVVLSACETGIGTYHLGEGVYGLQRAIKVAGARSIIMSLWKVDDQATQELMVHFYQHWKLGTDKRKAFRKAQQQLREKHPHPFYWGAFVMMGD